MLYDRYNKTVVLCKQSKKLTTIKGAKKIIWLEEERDEAEEEGIRHSPLDPGSQPCSLFPCGMNQTITHCQVKW